MVHWRTQYQAKIVTADAALGVLRSHQRVFIHMGAAAPQTLIEALCRRLPALSGVEILHCINMGPAPYVGAEFAGHARHVSTFIAPNVRDAVQRGAADWIPVFLHEMERLFTEGYAPLDVALIQVSPPDDNGYLSLGPSVDISMTAARAARHLIVQVNPQMPRTFGESTLHASDIHAIIESDRPLPEFHQGEIGALHHEIARHVAPLIPDEATLQVGIGGIPDAVLMRLRDRRNLGIHTELLTDGLLDLIECGAVTNACKSIHRHRTVTAFAMGSTRLYRFLHDNPAVEFYPSQHTNDPYVIAQNHRMTSINSAIEIDLGGQVCSDSVGPLPFSGFGGQVDFVRGASRRSDGRAIIALPATAKNGAISRIVPRLKPGAGVVTSRADVRWVATEYGAVNLFGKSLRQRAELLISIAAPQFREELQRAAATLWVRGA